jgi:hypothetical protein
MSLKHLLLVPSREPYVHRLIDCCQLPRSMTYTEKQALKISLDLDNLFRASDYPSSGAGTWSVRFSVGVESTLTPVSCFAGLCRDLGLCMCPRLLLLFAACHGFQVFCRRRFLLVDLVDHLSKLLLLVVCRFPTW